MTPDRLPVNNVPNDSTLPVSQTLFSETITHELSLAGVNPGVEMFSSLITSWVQKERQTRKVEATLLDEIQERAQYDVLGAISLVAQTIEDGTVHRSMRTSVNDLRRSVRVGLSEAENRQIDIGVKSPTLTLGSESHRIAEVLIGDEKFWHAFPQNLDLLIEGENVIGFVERKVNDQVLEQTFLGGDPNFGIKIEEPVGEANVPTTSPEAAKVISLEYPIPKPLEGQSRLHWALDTIKNGLGEIYLKANALPEKPSDIAKMVKDDNLRKTFMQIIGVSQFLFDFRNGLSQVQWNKGVGTITADQINGFKSIDTLVLARIALERYQGYTWVNSNQVVLNEIEEGDLSVTYHHERKDGTEGMDRVAKSHRVKSGKIDLLKIYFESERQAEQDYNLDLMRPLPDPDQQGRVAPLDNYRKLLSTILGARGSQPNFDNLQVGNVHLVKTLLGFMESTVGAKIAGTETKATWKRSDVIRWKSQLELQLSSGGFGKNAGFEIKDAIKTIEKKFKKHGRNLETLFRELYIIYGERVFTDLAFEVGDLKFPAGDSTEWFSVYQSNNLPQSKDVRQVETYLFKIAAQLFRVRKWADQKFEVSRKRGIIAETKDDVVSVDKISRFIKLKSFKLLDRLKGVVLYQTSSNAIPEEIVLSQDKTALKQTGERAFRIDPERNDELLERIRVLRALRRIVGPRLDGVERVTKEKEKMPAELQEICIQNDGGIFLSIEGLSRVLTERMVGEVVEITQGAHLMDQDVKVFWVKNLQDGLPPLRISINKKGKYAIDGLKDFGRVTGRLLSNEDFLGVHENSEELYKLYGDKVWGIVKILLDGKEVYSSNGVVVQSGEVSTDNTTKILWPDGSIRESVPGKPIVCQWDGMTGRWFLNPQLLKIAAENGSDKHDTLRLYNLVREKSKRNKQILCPISSHPNLDKQSRAAQWSPKFLHVICRTPGCAGSIDISKALGVKREWAKIDKGPENYEVANFHPLNSQRSRVLATTVELAGFFSQVDGSATRYITQVRSLATEDVGEFGYMPPWFVKTLRNLYESETFKSIAQKNPDAPMVDFVKQLSGFAIADAQGRFTSGMRQLLKRLEPLGDVGRVLSVLPARIIKEMGEVEVIDQSAHLGGGVIFPLYWVSQNTDSGLLAVSNVNVRGITLDGKRLFKGRGHWKVKQEFEDENQASGLGGWREPTPAGVWVRDPARFIDSVARSKVVTVCEGIFNAASFERISAIDGRSEFVHSSVATVGTGYRTLYAFLRHLGIRGDRNPPKESLGLNIETIVLAPDFDGPGTSYYERRFNDFVQLFDKLDVLPVHSVLPEIIKDVIPRYDPALFKIGKPLEKFKLDINDLLQSHTDGWTPNIAVTAETKDVIDKLRNQMEVIRAKYAHISQNSH